MSERLYGCFLRLYPRQFREAYGDEAHRLFRDRCADEQGFYAGLRLWFDLLADLFISVPIEHRRLTLNRETSFAWQSVRGDHPAFGMLDCSQLPPKPLLVGSVLSLLGFFVLLFSVNYGARNHSLNTPGVKMQTLDFWQSSVCREISMGNSPGNADVLLLGKRFFSASKYIKPKMRKPNTLPGDLSTVRIHSEHPLSRSVETSAGQAFWKWFCAFNSGDPEALEAYIISVDPADTLTWELRFRKLTGGFHLQAVISNEPDVMRVLLRDRNSWTRFVASIRVAPGVPPQVVTFDLSRVPKGSIIQD